MDNLMLVEAEGQWGQAMRVTGHLWTLRAAVCCYELCPSNLPGDHPDLRVLFLLCLTQVEIRVELSCPESTDTSCFKPPHQHSVQHPQDWGDQHSKRPPECWPPRWPWTEPLLWTEHQQNSRQLFQHGQCLWEEEPLKISVLIEETWQSV